MNKLNRIIQIYNFVYLIESFCNLVNMVKNDAYFMKFALSQAKLAREQNEVPVGAVIVYENNVISRAHNMVELLVSFGKNFIIKSLPTHRDAIIMNISNIILFVL